MAAPPTESPPGAATPNVIPSSAARRSKAAYTSSSTSRIWIVFGTFASYHAYLHVIMRISMLSSALQARRAFGWLAAARRRMPGLAVDKEYTFDGPDGAASLLDLFHGRRQLIIYRAFFEPRVDGWPDHACRGCSLIADQVANVAHLNARDTTLVFVSRAPQADIARVKGPYGLADALVHDHRRLRHSTSAWTNGTAPMP